MPVANVGVGLFGFQGDMIAIMAVTMVMMLIV
jgi:hypothetical protein